MHFAVHVAASPASLWPPNPKYLGRAPVPVLAGFADPSYFSFCIWTPNSGNVLEIHLLNMMSCPLVASRPPLAALIRGISDAFFVCGLLQLNRADPEGK